MSKVKDGLSHCGFTVQRGCAGCPYEDERNEWGEIACTGSLATDALKAIDSSFRMTKSLEGETMKRDFIVRRSITMIDGKPHVETYSEQELVRCKDCTHRYKGWCCAKHHVLEEVKDDFFCADGERKDQYVKGEVVMDTKEVDCREDCCGNCVHSHKTDIDGLVICMVDGRSRDDDMVCDEYEWNLK